MNRFKTLLLREWMQHRIGWLVLMAVPLAGLLLAMVFGSVQLDEPSNEMPVGALALPLALGTVCVVGVLLLGLAWVASVIQSPALARRDVQDRSIEFWLSLPVPHAHSLGATLLMHLVLVPWLALGAGLLGGLVLSAVIVTRVVGFGEWLALPWGQILGVSLIAALRVGVGLALATLWLGPLILGTMAASAWLKRWGVAAVALVVGVGGLLLERLYGITWLLDAVRTLGEYASRSFIAADRASKVAFVVNGPQDLADIVGRLSGLLLGDLADALMLMATPAFALSLLASAAAFALLWWRGVRAH